MSQDTHPCKVVLAGNIAKSLLSEVQAGLSALGRTPHLLGILANSDPAAQVYADWTERTCKENGFQYSLKNVAKDDVEETIMAANNDPAVDGIIVYYPIFNNRQDQYLQQIVDVSKDVEGLSHQYIFNMYQNIRFLDEEQAMKSVLPCTPLAVIKILEYLHIYNTILPYGNRLFGRTICVVNRSEVVGRPLAALLANDGACVYSVDVTGVQQFTRGEGIRKRKHEVVEKEGWTIEDCAPLCDVVITGVPGDKYKFPCHLLKEGAVCINFSSEKNFGPEVKQKAAIYVPAIGKVTIVVLLRNLLRIVQNRQAQAEKSKSSDQKTSEPVVNGATS
ncbi:methylenetetrahydrofolate dehydrogenase (NAD+) [Capronia coronata CBS 617.96]|uniref:Methylenetetrahydrofolate dehydrogenase [NAD(+)] n=1 Tax=Capronia coronata CBS 617.96 TaxID=1182541 RepID=W9Z2G8_9EURO|nr:methylenetetrahydrofolate dehydrogenase (NAD+) [Capronia coronata CBS 617.96]EXJ88709.1 methylenetetrahydrofolate dehydrogenase (NAD+) [Capronia coronata CBS 617.96]